MIDRLLAAGGGDWIDDVADVLPMSVIGDIIGIPDEDRPRDLRHARPHPQGRTRPTSPVSRSRTQLELFGKIFTYALELTAEKRRNPTDDIWSTLTSAVVTDENGEQLSIPANELEIFFFVHRVRRQRHHQERVGLRTAGVRRQSRADRAVPSRRSDPGERGRRGAALVDAGRVLDAQHEGRRGDGRRHHPEG